MSDALTAAPAHPELTARVQLRFADVNAGGHVANTAVPLLFDEARVRTLGWGGPGSPVDGLLRLAGDDAVVLVGQATTEYLREIRYRGQDVEIRSWVTGLGGARWAMSAVLLDDGDVAALHEATLVLGSTTTGRPLPLPDAFRARLAGLAGPVLPLRERLTDLGAREGAPGPPAVPVDIAPPGAAPADGEDDDAGLVPLVVDLDMLASVLESGPETLGGRLDLATGETWPTFDDGWGAEIPDERVAGADEEDRWLDVDPQGSRSAYQDMVDFTETVTDARLRARLEVALDGRGAFGRFSRAIDADDTWRPRWLDYREAGRLDRARAWLAARGYRPASD